MILSVIIVSYQVKYFLEQCLFSVEKALEGIEGGSEIIVIDNDSGDGTLAYLQPGFPKVRFIANPDNPGFARANNRALEVARGQYILFLNPDTILPEDACHICLDFMTATPGIGAAGVRMVDGSGRFLKESRRGFPSPWTAFCKLSGLTTLFPRSPRLAGYYLGHLPEKKTHPAPILSGACLWVRREVLDKAGAFDPSFFMYAEDIDLSYRIEQAGFTNYYIAETTILHFKGESTHKDARYIKLFYKAMVQFRRKHFKSTLSRLFNGFLEAAAWCRVRLAPRSHPAGRPPYDHQAYPVGDPITRERLITLLPPAMLAQDKQQADEIILCEGGSFSFKDCINALQTKDVPGWLREGDHQTRFLIHAGASSSVVGSPSAEERGITIVL